jgi:hypothetical protein
VGGLNHFDFPLVDTGYGISWRVFSMANYLFAFILKSQIQRSGMLAVRARIKNHPTPGIIEPL